MDRTRNPAENHLRAWRHNHRPGKPWRAQSPEEVNVEEIPVASNDQSSAPVKPDWSFLLEAIQVELRRQDITLLKGARR